jgi:uncharacterized protein YyaL (SSP411 family)
MIPIHTNKLITETSPYLLQHAHNPVNWYPWGEEAIALAKKENKPILVSIGYSACHWCHVMEKESFENEEVAKLMNKNFVNIKIDREERPDLDQIYMDAVQAMSGQGGWPLNVFLTPDTKPFYGGTYFPPVRAYNRASWTEVLQGVADAFSNRPDEIIAQANSLTEHLKNANSFGIAAGTNKEKNPHQQAPLLSELSASTFTNENVQEIAKALIANADKQWGGFGKAPKFPQTYCIQFLLRHAHYFKQEESLNVALLSLDKMMQGGIYDQLGGGFARYSTDAEWLAPHFEKMLYDNALLISVYSEAYQLTGRSEYLQIVNETMQFVRREMYDEKTGAFYAAIDADSEGVEGKFYVWSKDEIEKLLGEEASVFTSFYDVSENGNWEHVNILWVRKSIEQYCAEQQLEVNETQALLDRCRKKLLEHRANRIRPALDDKILLGWNALMNWACSKAYAASGNKTYIELAEKNMQFLLQAFSVDNSKGTELLNFEAGFLHTWKNGQAKYPAFLEDMAFLIQALIILQETTANLRWLELAEDLTKLTINKFGDLSSPYFYFTSIDQTDVIVRKKEIYDGALPSVNALMASSLYKLSLYLDRPEWAIRSAQMLQGVQDMVKRYPVSFGCWAGFLMELNVGTAEISLLGENHKEMLVNVLNIYIPHKIIMASASAQPKYPLLKEKQADASEAYFLCENYACQKPVFSLDEFKKLITKG